MKIFVDNISFEIMDDFVRAAFEQYGQVVSARIARERNGSDSRGYAIVEMPVEAEALRAIAELNGKDMVGRPLEVTAWKPDSESRRNRIVNPRSEPRQPRQTDTRRKPRPVRGTGPEARYGKLG